MSYLNHKIYKGIGGEAIISAQASIYSHFKLLVGIIIKDPFVYSVLKPFFILIKKENKKNTKSMFDFQFFCCSKR